VRLRKDTYFDAVPAVVISPGVARWIHLAAISGRADSHRHGFGVHTAGMLKGERNIGVVSVKEVLGVGSTMEFDKGSAAAWGSQQTGSVDRRRGG
jgi:hypothetical protein